MLASEGEHVGESDFLILAMGAVLIVETSVPRVVTIAWHVGALGVAINVVAHWVELGDIGTALYIYFIVVSAQ